jgi:2,4-dienoyl-CoA reductase-like NADH-dependent reductase (Old Yellow Enzyme family)/thioredoxin reductase
MITMGSRYTHVFSPIRIRGIDFKNRITLAPPSPNLASSDGLVTHDFVDWFRMFARGGVCTLYVGNCSIDINECKDEAFQLNLANPNGVLPMTWYADMCKQYACHASFEINHNGENTRYETVGHWPYSSSARISDNERRAAEMNHREPHPCIEMSIDKIHETVEKYGSAAGQMKRAGMDIVLVHGGHGNLISQFTSPLYNKRTDEYGGDTKGRARFAIEVCDSIRRHCGEDFVIEFRISADEIAPEGMHFDETLELIGYLKDHIDILHVSAGLHSDFNMAYFNNWCQNYLMDHGFNVHFARDVKKAYPDLLVNTVGSIMNLDYAEEIIANGWADFVSMCRPLMADPDMPNKYAENRPEDRRPCLRCNTCMNHLMIPKPIYCAINPISAMTGEIKDGIVHKAAKKKKVAIVGGGPGGIQAMQTLLDRGHDVTLYEKSDHLGGNVVGAAVPYFKIDVRDYLKWMRHTAQQCTQRGAKILLNTEATKEMLDLGNYDAVVLAVGAEPVIPKSIPGINKPHVQWAPDAEEDLSKGGKNIVIVGAGQVGLEAALDFAHDGEEPGKVPARDPKDTIAFGSPLTDPNTSGTKRKITVIEMLAPMASMRRSRGSMDLMKALKDYDVEIKYETALAEVKDDCVVVKDAKTGELSEIKADTVLLAMGIKPRFDVVDSLRHCAPESNVAIVGDCNNKAGTISEAVNQAFQACIHI